MDSRRGRYNSPAESGGKHNNLADSPEQLLDVFKAAALSVTKLYKTSAAGLTKARSDGYQDCLDDLLSFLDRQSLGLGDGEGWRIRGWATERLNGRETAQQNTESDEDTEKPETAASPELVRASIESRGPSSKPEPIPAVATNPVNSSTSNVVTAPEGPYHFVVPSQDAFTFQSSHQYPNIATLDLSDAISSESQSHNVSKSSRSRLHGGSNRPTGKSNVSLGRGAGSKRKMDFSEFFPGCFNPKDGFGSGGKRSRHT